MLITEGGWAGNGAVVGMATANYYLHVAFPDLIGKEDVFRGLTTCSGRTLTRIFLSCRRWGRNRKQVAYGMNRADFSFIPGGIVPGVLVLKPDFPENKEDWPFLWGENEYVISLGASYLLLANAASDLVADWKPACGDIGFSVTAFTAIFVIQFQNSGCAHDQS